MKKYKELKILLGIIKSFLFNNVFLTYKKTTIFLQEIEKQFKSLDYKKIVININDYGFGLSDEALKKLSDIKNEEINEINQFDIKRDDKDLVLIVEEMGLLANDQWSKLSIVRIPKFCCFKIDRLCGKEKVYVDGIDFTNKFLK
jgi:hypothetical protein